MRKKVVALGAILLLIGAAMVAYGIHNAGNAVEEKTYNLSNPEEFREWIIASGKEDPTPSSIDPVIILGTIVAAFGVVFLVKSKDKDFLPGI
jgi:uncharacterized membrane protein HdeD (DUF308 family)